ncbi:carboxylating nicotinate-nucleotide diphosphorylase [Rubritalea marina]|uniref:carboxylating nicotinate-nucleotide diphosphorylase n=1 Tax=Rubritalea marina TaxID=361055 RepID=UPI0003A08DD1|nr:carboxylating nicotinate-nucleotide diphosphorylase [Rubritalea marina]
MPNDIDLLIELALREDIGAGDVTAEYFVPDSKLVRAMMLVKADGVIAGLEVAEKVIRLVDPELLVKLLKVDGDSVAYGDHVMQIEGSAKSILTAERTALNFAQRLSGVATKTATFVQRVQGTKVQVLDTRKTTPGWRMLEKAAVISGGGMNHRMGLYDRAMVKDNHLVAESGLSDLQVAIDTLKAEKPAVQVELEADTLAQVQGFLSLRGVDYILLDNMSNDQLEQAVAMRGTAGPRLEASGGVNLDSIASIAATGVDFISVGALTHSAVALDISLEFFDL